MRCQYCDFPCKALHDKIRAKSEPYRIANHTRIDPCGLFSRVPLSHANTVPASHYEGLGQKRVRSGWITEHQG